MIKQSDLIDEKTNDGNPPTGFVSITRIINAPRELVFRAWTDPEYLSRWYAPHDCSIHFSSIDIRPGGSFHACIKNPKYHDCWSKGVYLEIVAPQRIVYSLAVADEKGNLIKPVEAGMDPDWPAATIVTVTLEALQNKTRLTLHQTVLESIAKRTGAHPSWIQMFDRLEESLSPIIA